MKKMILLIFLIINIIEIYAQTNEQNVFAKSSANLINNVLTINITIYNNKNCNIFVPITDWLFIGLKNSNYFGTSYWQTYLINEIWYFPDYYKESSTNGDGIIDYKSDKMPTIIIIESQDSIKLTIKKKIKDFNEYFIKDKNYYFDFSLSYCDNEEIYAEICHALNCDFRSMFKTENEYTINLNNQKNGYDIGYEYCNCCPMDSTRSQILRIGFLNRIKTNCKLILNKK